MRRLLQAASAACVLLRASCLVTVARQLELPGAATAEGEAEAECDPAVEDCGQNWIADDPMAGAGGKAMQANNEGALTLDKKALNLALHTAQQRMSKVAMRRAKRHKQHCDRFPHFCRLGCDRDVPQPPEWAAWDAGKVTVEGTANPRPLCFNWTKLSYYGDCLLGVDMQKFVDKTHSNPDVLFNQASEYDGGYCMMSGHCHNSNVTLETNGEQAVHVCDAEFGRNKWSHFHKDYIKLFQDTSGVKQFHSVKESRLYAKLTCALGLFHCDVVRCQATFCQDPVYKEKYGQLWDDSKIKWQPDQLRKNEIADP